MRCPSVRDLPPPPINKRGWPWQVETEAQAVDLAAKLSLPKISIVTPSLNQGAFLEQTIRSVLLQNYPNLEYLVIDGGSHDESAELIRKYEKWLAYWVSEPDHGQSHAINKGFKHSTGEILGWLNSDDFYLPGTLTLVGRLLAKETGNFALVGHAQTCFQDERAPVFEEGKYVDRRRLLKFWKGYQMHQPSIFWRREVFEKVGFLNEDLNLIMDFDYWARIAEFYPFINVPQVLSCRNHHPGAKTSDNCVTYFKDLAKHRHRYWGAKWSPGYWMLTASMTKYTVIKPLLRRLRLS